MRKAIAELVTEIAESARVVGRLPRPGEGLAPMVSITADLPPLEPIW